MPEGVLTGTGRQPASRYCQPASQRLEVTFVKDERRKGPNHIRRKHRANTTSIVVWRKRKRRKKSTTLCRPQCAIYILHERSYRKYEI